MALVDKVKGLLGQHSDKVQQGMDKAGDMIDRKTGGKYADKVDKAQDAAKNYVEKNKGEQQPPQ